MEAVSNDERVAEQILDRNERDPEVQTPPKRRMSEYSADVEMLTVLADRISELIALIASVNGARPGPMRPAPRPETAVERVRDRRRIDRHNKLVARVLPHQSTE